MGKSLFFNAMPDLSKPNGYDRNYNADDISNFFSMIWENGVCKTNTVDAEPQGLKVVASNGMVVNVNAGFAAIKGKAFINQAIESFTVAANGSTSTRYDYIVLKYDNNISVRDITLELRTGTSARPTLSNLTRTASVYELMLGYIAVAPSATSVTQANITDTRGEVDLCPWFTAVKGYDDYYDAIVQQHESTVTLQSASNTVVTNILSGLYNSRYSLIEVYTNGLREAETEYTVSASGGYIVVTFRALKASGTSVTVIMNNFIDGEGLVTALKQYTQLVQDVANLKAVGEFNYFCNGVNDNIAISTIAQTFINASTSDYNTLKLNIYGNIGFTAPYQGDGSISNPFIWFAIGGVNRTRKVILDFGGCSQIALAISDNLEHIIFGGNEATVKNAVVYPQVSLGATATIKVFNSLTGKITATDCKFWLATYNQSYIASAGTFNNCDCWVKNSDANGFCFHLATASAGALIINGGKLMAYTNSGTSAVVNVNVSDGAVLCSNINCPTKAETGYYQSYSIRVLSGNCYVNGIISTLENTGGTIYSQIALNKPL